MAEVQMGREVCGDLEIAESREWLVTNGLGGFASGTVAGTSTRRYHGLLVAALQPPVRRTLLVNGLDESVRYLGTVHSLATNRWTSGFVSPRGYLQLESFHLEGSKPVWRYALADALLEKRVWMKQGENTTYVQYSLLRGNASIELEGKALVNYRDFHHTTQAQGWKMKIVAVDGGLRVLAFEAAAPFYLKSANATWSPQHQWYCEFFLPVERERGLEDHEDRLFAGLFRCHVGLGESVTIVLSTEENAVLEGEQARTQQANHEWKLYQAWQGHHAKICTSQPEDEPGWLWQLVVAADQFVVERVFADQTKGRSIIAGYPWFSDWGRDAMIALPGLALSLGRPETAREVLRTFARFVERGLMPNTFPDSGEAPQYNTADATLWFVEALRQYFETTQDLELIRELFPVLAGIVDAHVHGTMFQIQVDPEDALLSSGTLDVQLTWMDAKIGDWVVTPRSGKTVEINALWINALQTMAIFAASVQRPREGYEKLVEKATRNFQKFWNVDRECCYDVIDTPGGERDALLRPNQIFAVSLPVSPLSPSQQKAVVDCVAQQLLTSHGLRSLGPQEPGYKGKSGGGQRERDTAYHQGTVWGWLLGPFALAHYKVYRDAAMAQSFLEPLGKTICSGGLGTLGEVFGGDAPFPPGGCPAQAWSVAEVFRSWQFLSAEIAPLKAGRKVVTGDESRVIRNHNSGFGR
jgi:predicted glycogen debranching enzyme